MMSNKCNLTDTLYCYSKLYKSSIHKEDVQILLESSPAYPTMLSLYRTLHSIEIECNVVKAKFEDIAMLNKPFLAHLKGQTTDNIILIKEIVSNNILWYNTANSRFYKESIDTFLKKWDGIILYSTDKEISINRRCIYIYITLLCLFAIPFFNITNLAIVALNIIGLYSSYIIFAHEKGKRGTVLNKICKVGKHIDCDSVAHSKFSRFGNITLADLGLTYFGTALFFSFSLLYNPFNINTSETYSAILIISFPFILYSLSVQLYIKKWCILCLSLDSIIILQACLFFIKEDFSFTNTITPFFQISYFFPLILLVVILLKKYSTTKSQYIEQKIHSLRIHRTPSVFNLFINKATVIRQDEYGLSIGDPNAPLTITTWISPHCPHCTEIVKNMFLFIHNKKVQWKIYFAGTDQNTENNRRYIVELYFIALFISNKTQFLNAIKQWYNHDQTPIFKKLSKYRINKNAELILEKHISYAKEIGIKEYPTIFINNIRLPQEYTLNDLYYMIYDHDIINVLNTSNT
ncbi:peptidase C39 bacteriocin processing [Bacteroides intestinalis CAG:315]|jgi:uncharacterized membrane protein/glutaredoxin|uniref:Peptidase C39 domain-containing protein n=1 Tax=Bacteroides intestinalis TaxID=329854 RepID=A0A412YFW9_9BACE|nr:vitamin K epoxide reductase family protein [Bacteroides intestinalis]RGV56243.1 hypothetical protein DWW10_06050 [Bacteroides intestinalis]RHA59380.1 hypothetical protein DW932_14145 [Bacteroides intestinalis]CDD98244.1 peptidase C39 bacteriocin processing [Bacteroides intestinalis CAG:315]